MASDQCHNELVIPRCDNCAIPSSAYRNHDATPKPAEPTADQTDARARVPMLLVALALCFFVVTPSICSAVELPRWALEAAENLPHAPPPLEDDETVAPSPTPASTKILSVEVSKRVAAVAFQGNSASSFICKLDRNRWVPCTSPKTFRHLRLGRHRIAVAGISEAGAIGEAAVMHFRCPKAQF
jgi:hypothetical protein